MGSVALIHVYSRRSGGDGLLTDLSLRRLRRAGVPRSAVHVLSLDARSFGDLPRVYQVGVPGGPADRGVPWTVLELGQALLARATRGRLQCGRWLRLLSSVDAVVAVGGGYLRADRPFHRFGALLNHVPQILAFQSTRRPAFYLPASIGPFAGWSGRWLRGLFRGMDVVCARDDRTVADLAPITTVHRVPDLAVLEIAERGVEGSAGRGGPVVVAPRELGSDPGYEGRLRALAAALPRCRFGVQTTGKGRKDDGRFIRRLGCEPVGSMAALLAEGVPGAVVSVRLHGALQALLAGVPAIHLSYGHKGRAAYADLDLGPYVHDAREFDPEAVARQARELAADGSDLWRRIEGRLPALRLRSRDLDRELGDWLARRLGPAPGDGAGSRDAG